MELKVVKMAWLVGLLEVGIEVILVILRWDFEFLSRCMDRTDSLVFAAGHLFYYVNYAPGRIKNNSTVLYCIFRW